MSQQTPPPGASGEGQPSEEEVRAYLSQLRQAPAEQVLAEVLSGLLNAAQVKVGRRDGRLLIDASATLIDEVREHLSEDLRSQVDEVVGQLRMAQVEGEREVAQASEQGHEEPNDLGSAPSAGSPAPGSEDESGSAAAPPPSESSQQAGSRLWTPGS